MTFFISHELIVKSLQGRSTALEEDRLAHWRRRSHDNEAVYESIAPLWSLAEVASPQVEPTSRLSADEVIARAESPDGKVLKLESRRQERGANARRWMPVGRMQAALAASIAIVGLAIGHAFNAAITGWAGGRTVVSEVTTGAGEMATFTLTDGSAVRVGPQTTLQLLEGGGRTVVHLDGRAFFGVRSDPSRQFVVRTAHGEVTALGTRFEVRSQEQNFRVLVVEGNVRVSAAGTSLELDDGLMSESIEGSPLGTVRVDRVEPLLDWMGTTLLFRNTPVRRALGEIEERYGVPIYLGDQTLGDLTITATFTDQEVETVAFVICEMIGAECAVERDGRIRIGVSDH